MFSLQIVESDAFLDMPMTSQVLYFHLGMHADDDGFVNPKSIMRLVGASSDDLKILIGKRFVLTFENGVIVIKHWFIHNTLRKDRYNETKYTEQKKMLRLKENGAYTEQWQPNGNQMVPQIKLKEIKVNKNKVKEINTSEQSSQIVEVIKIFESINPTINYGNTTTRKSVIKLIKQFGLEDVIRLSKYAVGIQGKPYSPTITTPYQLENKLAELRIYSQKNINQSKVIEIL